MKRYTLAALIIWLLSGCAYQSSGQHVDNELSKQIEELTNENKTLKSELEETRRDLQNALLDLENYVSKDYGVVASEKITDYPITLYKEVQFDLNNDGVLEKVELYVNAGKLDNGVLAWDDGQRWLLLVEQGGETYPLFDDFVQLGSVDFTIANFDEEVAVVMLKTSHASKDVQKFVYDDQQNGFVKETFYKLDNVNNFYNDPAARAFFNDAFKLLNEVYGDLVHIIDKAQEGELKDRWNRQSIVDPAYTKLLRAARLFNTAAELNLDLSISVEGLQSFLNELIISEPTNKQVEILKEIQRIYDEKEVLVPILDDETKLNPLLQEKLDNIDTLLTNQ